MTLIERLAQYNAWRRGEDESLQQPHPTQIGKDIDEAIAKLAAAERLADLLRRHDIAQKKLDVPYCKEFSETLAEAYCDSELYEDTQDALTAYSRTRKEQHDDRFN